MTVGRVCVKINGRDKGGKCIIVNVQDDKFVLITGPKNITNVRRKKVNILHLKPLDKVIKIRRNATDESITSMLTRMKLEDFMRSK